MNDKKQRNKPSEKEAFKIQIKYINPSQIPRQTRIFLPRKNSKCDHGCCSSETRMHVS